MYKNLIRPVLFLLSPEKVHHLVFKILKSGHRFPGVPAFLRRKFVIEDRRLRRHVFGLDFKNPVGIAAGFDKDGKLYRELGDLGFGFIEVGTVTPRAQPGNEKPRLFRLPLDKAIINRMGFNNEGVDALAKRLKNRRDYSLIIGGNIGKNKLTENQDAIFDYLHCFNTLFSYVDYFVVNVSSPNTPNLRDLQEKGPLLNILKALQEENFQHDDAKPILLKIAPDLNDSQLNDIVDIVKESGIAGVIATNTTISRENLKTDPSVIEKAGSGGLSGKPLKERSTEVIRYLHQRSGGSFPIIAVGGIFTPEDALEKLEAGASLVQVYTGFIYEGPAIAREICKRLLASGY